MAVQRRLQSDRVEEVFAKLLAELRSSSSVSSFSSRPVSSPKRTALPIFSCALRKGTPLLDEIGRRGHGIEIAGCRRRSSCGRSGTSARGEGGQDAKDSGDGVGGVEDRLLAFLQVLVVRERQAFESMARVVGRAEQSARTCRGAVR